MTDGRREAKASDASDRREQLRRLLEERAVRRYPLSPQQKRLWVAHGIDSADPSHNVRSALEIRGGIERATLQEAVERLVGRHEQLRARFPTRDGEPVTEIRSRLDVAPQHLELPHAASEGDVAALLARTAAEPFDLERGPIFRWALLDLGDDRLIALFVVHHIACDAWSMSLLLDELVELLAASEAGREAELPVVGASYEEFAGAQRSLLTDPHPEHEAFWRRSLAGARPVPLGADTSVRTGSRESHRRSFAFDPSLTERLRQVCHRHGASLNMVLLGGFTALLHRRFAVPELVVTMPVANRQDETWERLVGYFVNLLPLRIDCSAAAGFDDLLAVVRAGVLAAYDHQELPVHRIAEIAGVRQSALLEVLFQHRGGETGLPTVPGLELSIRTVDVGRSRTRLALSTHLDGDRLAGTFEYDTRSFPDGDADRLVADLQRVLEQIGADDTIELGQLAVSRSSISVADPAAPVGATAAEAKRNGPPAGGTGPASTVRRLGEIWRQVLAIEELQPFDNFLDVGGDSLAALQIIERVEQDLGVRLAPADLFTQTLAQLATQCEKRRD